MSEIQKTSETDQLIDRIKSCLRDEFPEDTVDVTTGFRDNIHVVVVSRKFDNLGEKTKQDYLWSIIDQSDLSEEDKLRISMILPYSPAELK